MAHCQCESTLERWRALVTGAMKSCSQSIFCLMSLMIEVHWRTFTRLPLLEMYTLAGSGVAFSGWWAYASSRNTGIRSSSSMAELRGSKNFRLKFSKYSRVLCSNQSPSYYLASDRLWGRTFSLSSAWTSDHWNEFQNPCTVFSSLTLSKSLNEKSLRVKASGSFWNLLPKVKSLSPCLSILPPELVMACYALSKSKRGILLRATRCYSLGTVLTVLHQRNPMDPWEDPWEDPRGILVTYRKLPVPDPFGRQAPDANVLFK